MYPHKDNCIPNNIANPDIRYIEGRPGPQGSKGADGTTKKYYWKGIIHQAKVYNSVLSSSEISNLVTSE